jgi:hypothetical protein
MNNNTELWKKFPYGLTQVAHRMYEIFDRNGKVMTLLVLPEASMLQNKCILAYNDLSTKYAKAIVITISGTTPTFETSGVDTVNFEIQVDSNISIGTDKSLICIRQNTAIPNTSIYYIVTCSGVNVSFCDYCSTGEVCIANSAALLDENTALVSMVLTGTNEPLRVISIDISTTTPSIKFVSDLSRTYSSASTETAIEKITDNRFVLFVSNTSFNEVILFDYMSDNVKIIKRNPLYLEILSIAETTFPNVIYLDNDRSILTYLNSSNYPCSVVFPTQYYNRVIGISADTATTGNDCEIYTKGVISGLSGLTEGEMYYLQDDGTIDLTPTNLRIGISISTTELLININSYM